MDNCGCYDGGGFFPISPLDDLSPCFLALVVNAIGAIFIIGGSVEILKLRQRRNIISRQYPWFPIKLLLITIGFAFQLAQTIIMAHNNVYPEGVSYLNDQIWWSSVIALAVSVLSFLLTYIEFYKSYISSTSMILYWLTYSIIGLFRIINVILRKPATSTTFMTVSITIISWAIFTLEAEFQPSPVPIGSHEKYSYMDYANIWGLLTFTWMTPIMEQGKRQYLELHDVPPPPYKLRTKNSGGVLRRHWQEELKKENPSLARALFKSFFTEWLVGQLFELLKDFVSFGQRPVLQVLIMFVDKYNKSKGDVSLVGGFMLALAMFSLSILESILLQGNITKVTNTGIMLKTSSACLIHEKALSLSVESRQKHATGDIVNMMSVDCQRLENTVQNIDIVWSGALQISLSMWYLHRLMGNSMWIGIAIMCLTFPINYFLTGILRAAQRAQMKLKDQRTSLTSEILNNIKSLKLYAWEEPYRKKLMHVRNDLELKNMQKVGILNALYDFIFNMLPALVKTTTFGLFIYLYNIPLGPELAFPALSLFNMMEMPLSMAPRVINDTVEASVALQRIQTLLLADEIDPNAVKHLEPENGSGSVDIVNAKFLWSKEPVKVALSDVNFSAKPASLTCIVGRVGSGKSALVQALLGDIIKEKGDVTVKGRIAYVPQVPWIMNATVKENILFGFKEDPDFYVKVLDACALTKDLDVLPNGDLTQVGEKGISMSGGQKARLSLARAVYSRADIYILDDILSAVDEHVGKHIIENLLGPDGLLHEKCKILSTNNLHVLKSANLITAIIGGKIVEQGSYETLKADKSGVVSTLLQDFGTEQDNESDDRSSQAPVEKTKLPPAVLDDYIQSAQDEEKLKALSGSNEHTVQGDVDFKVYLSYVKACGVGGICLMVACIIAMSGVGVISSYWLKWWSDLNGRYGYNYHAWRNLGIYFGICFLSAVLSLTECLIRWLVCSIPGSKTMHQNMLDGVLHSPMQFFETTPIGRIMNRFSTDMWKIDAMMFNVFEFFLDSLVSVFFTLLVIVISSWQFIFVMIPLTFVYRYLQQYYLLSSRELRRLDSITKSPIFAQFQESLNGADTIRAYSQTARFNFLCLYKMDKNISTFHPMISANRWLSIRLESIGSLVILASSALLISTLPSGHVTSGLIGLSVSYALQITQSLNRMVRMSVKIESEVVSIERVYEYAHLPSEAPSIIEKQRPQPDWPNEGVIKFEDYSTRYREDLPLVLRNVNLAIDHREKVGIVGRTGAGKSSLTLAIFRMIEASEGHIVIDDIQTDKIGLFDLRSRLSIIPQDAQVFQGTIRSNLDPVDQFSDEEIWEALKLCHLDVHVKAMYEDLADKESIQNNPLLVPLSEGGSNLSVGQRQLICLSRALCKKKSELLVLDEATANVDVETDSIIQNTIRTAMKDRTIITIAHRLNTIIDSDRIVVLDKGHVVEFDKPQKLLENKDSFFYALCHQGGLLNQQPK